MQPEKKWLIILQRTLAKICCKFGKLLNSIYKALLWFDLTNYNLDYEYFSTLKA